VGGGANGDGGVGCDANGADGAGGANGADGAGGANGDGGCGPCGGAGVCGDEPECDAGRIVEGDDLLLGGGSPGFEPGGTTPASVDGGAGRRWSRGSSPSDDMRASYRRRRSVASAGAVYRKWRSTAW